MIDPGYLIMCCMGGFGLAALAIMWRILKVDPPDTDVSEWDERGRE